MATISVSEILFDEIGNDYFSLVIAAQGPRFFVFLFVKPMTGSSVFRSSTAIRAMTGVGRQLKSNCRMGTSGKDLVPVIAGDTAYWALSTKSSVRRTQDRRRTQGVGLKDRTRNLGLRYAGTVKQVHAGAADRFSASQGQLPSVNVGYISLDFREQGSMLCRMTNSLNLRGGYEMH